MKRQLIHFNTKNYFENLVYVTGWIFACMALPTLLINWLIGLILGFLAYIILTSTYRVTINIQTKEINDFLFILNMKSQQEKFKYDHLDYIYITQNRYSQQLNLFPLSSTVRDIKYNAYLKSDVSNIYLGESKNLEKLKSKIQPLAYQLNLEINLTNLSEH